MLTGVDRGGWGRRGRSKRHCWRVCGWRGVELGCRGGFGFLRFWGGFGGFLAVGVV